MSVNYKLIADSIPAELMTLALATIGPDKQKTRVEYVNEVRKLVPMVDSDGNDVMTAGGFVSLDAVSDAFDAIKDISSVKSKNKYMQTYAGIADDVDFATSKSFSDSIKAAIEAGVLSLWVDNALNDAGINVNDPEVSKVLMSLIDSFGLTQVIIDSILSTGYEEVKTFPRLKLGHVQNAVHKRHTGDV